MAKAGRFSGMPIFDGLDRSLRWLRQRQKKRQYQVAKSAGITKSMLSAYETGKNDPTLKTLEKILAALDCDLVDLHNAVEIVNGRTATAHRVDPLPRTSWRTAHAGAIPQPADADGGDAASGPRPSASGGHLGAARPPLPEEIDLALTDMLDGCHRLLRQVLAAIVIPQS
jgi:transcriptional regulator with XRE-family HTH domain